MATPTTGKYLAMVKLAGAPAPQKLTFEAPSIGQAIDHMVKALGYTSTVNIEEFEVLQLMADGNSYIRVASKNKREERFVQRSVESTVVGPLTTTEPEPVKAEEKSFTPYKLAAA